MKTGTPLKGLAVAALLLLIAAAVVIVLLLLNANDENDDEGIDLEDDENALVIELDPAA